MNNSPRKDGFDVDIRSLLKHQHRKVYSICRFFANNYREHQALFSNIIAAASQNIRSRRDKGDKQTLLLRACINMAAIHTITTEMGQVTERAVQFKSPDYQRSMTRFRELVGAASDYEKFRLFLEFENVPADEFCSLTGIATPGASFPKKNAALPVTPIRRSPFNFIPYLKEKLVWN